MDRKPYLEWAHSTQQAVQQSLLLILLYRTLGHVYYIIHDVLLLYESYEYPCSLCEALRRQHYTVLLCAVPQHNYSVRHQHSIAGIRAIIYN